MMVQPTGWLAARKPLMDFTPKGRLFALVTRTVF